MINVFCRVLDRAVAIEYFSNRVICFLFRKILFFIAEIAYINN